MNGSGRTVLNLPDCVVNSAALRRNFGGITLYKVLDRMNRIRENGSAAEKHTFNPGVSEND